MGNCGLIDNHAYSLLTLRTTSTGVNLVKLRNPWGRGEWNGEWSDESKLWTPALRKELVLCKQERLINTNIDITVDAILPCRVGQMTAEIEIRSDVGKLQ